MKNSRKLRTALLAAASLSTAAAVAVPAYAAPAPTVEIAPVVHAADEVRAETPAVLKKAGLAAALTAATAAFFGLVGGKRLARWGRAAAPVAARAAKAVADVPVAAVKAVGRAAASPFRFVLILAGLGLFALTGFGLYDVEWLGGLIAGGAVVAAAWNMTRRKRVRVKAEKPSLRAPRQ